MNVETVLHWWNIGIRVLFYAAVMYILHLVRPVNN